jgi:hypothetical protein
MNKQLDLNQYYDSLHDAGKIMYDKLKSFIYQDSDNVCEMLFVSNPYFYVKEYEHIKPHYRPSVILVFYKDHVNIFAHAVKDYKSELNIYKITDKNTLQIYYDKPLLNEILIKVFKQSLQPID